MRMLLLMMFFISFYSDAITLRGQYSLMTDSGAIVPVENNDDEHALVEVVVKEIASPETNKEIKMQGGELLFTPSKQIIRKKSKANFKFSFNGERGAQERYFSVAFLQTPTSGLTRKEAAQEKTEGSIRASIGVGYVLVLPPKNPVQQYLLNRKGITNVGNVTLRVRAYGKNEKGDDISFVMPLLPDKTISLKKFSHKSEILGRVEGVRDEKFTLQAE
ncbi:hypothetical protein [Aeromonas sp. HMWF015]|uniref:hypothetical protein n=1 Tax=Aeromonas sp. HMWF015 TaxID=2056851 RepID=UPI000D332010|nr:hypothetical protein [Aeromonas sp. HMWF015]PTT50206.1 hypothetical protein DBR13_20910 [Aeromonas sp. HMWF015]